MNMDFAWIPDPSKKPKGNVIACSFLMTRPMCSTRTHKQKANAPLEDQPQKTVMPMKDGEDKLRKKRTRRAGGESAMLDTAMGLGTPNGGSSRVAPASAKSKGVTVFLKPLGSCVMFGTPPYFYQFAQVHCGASRHTTCCDHVIATKDIPHSSYALLNIVLKTAC
jgi:hypothetical protein